MEGLSNIIILYLKMCIMVYVNLIIVKCVVFPPKIQKIKKNLIFKIFINFNKSQMEKKNI